MDRKFKIGDCVRKIKGSEWHGVVVGVYETELTYEGYAVESAYERGSVQIYPAAALEPWIGKGEWACFQDLYALLDEKQGEIEDLTAEVSRLRAALAERERT